MCLLCVGLVQNLVDNSCLSLVHHSEHICIYRLEWMQLHNLDGSVGKTPAESDVILTMDKVRFECPRRRGRSPGAREHQPRRWVKSPDLTQYHHETWHQWLQARLRFIAYPHLQVPWSDISRERTEIQLNSHETGWKWCSATIWRSAISVSSQ